jgi:hypothetical protein
MENGKTATRELEPFVFYARRTERWPHSRNNQQHSILDGEPDWICKSCRRTTNSTYHLALERAGMTRGLLTFIVVVLVILLIEGEFGYVFLGVRVTHFSRVRVSGQFSGETNASTTVSAAAILLARIVFCSCHGF